MNGYRLTRRGRIVVRAAAAAAVLAFAVGVNAVMHDKCFVGNGIGSCEELVLRMHNQEGKQ